jgi:hypothetical protein
MGFRFRKSINIIPGVRLNLSNGAPSLSVGPRGASVSFGSRGTYANLGLPGTGLTGPRVPEVGTGRLPTRGSDRRLSRKPLISCQR